ncbi:endolytic transglycosylase MltG, partial [Kineococcus glutinatus]|uniref:endolytic transglycosylase MltG n=1 Tax=Kineococcus glutinatus TaxID=1070872 RepID=UPI0031EB34A4
HRAAAALLAAVVVLVLGAWAAWGTLGPEVARLTASDDYEGSGTGTVDVRVAEGDTGRAIGRTLEEADVVKTDDAYVRAAAEDTRTAAIQPGTYRLRKQMSAASAVALLLDPAARQVTRLVVPEGLRAVQVLDLVAAQTTIPRDQLDAAARDVAALGLPASAEGNVEGYLFPATYDVAPDATAPEVLRQMVQRAVTALDQLQVPEERRHDVVVVASLAQKEARTPEDMARVAQVLANRLQDGMPLQLDSTVSYATGTETVTTTAEQRATDSPYNTYRYPGLPAGPISNPGEAALRAALDPEPGPWRFFVTVDLGTGETRFAETKAEHDANVELFRAWLRANPQ